MTSIPFVALLAREARAGRLTAAELEAHLARVLAAARPGERGELATTLRAAIAAEPALRDLITTREEVPSGTSEASNVSRRADDE